MFVFIANSGGKTPLYFLALIANERTICGIMQGITMKTNKQRAAQADKGILVYKTASKNSFDNIAANGGECIRQVGTVLNNSDIDVIYTEVNV